LQVTINTITILTQPHHFHRRNSSQKFIAENIKYHKKQNIKNRYKQTPTKEQHPTFSGPRHRPQSQTSIITSPQHNPRHHIPSSPTKIKYQPPPFFPPPPTNAF
jgi:hypothetical protein